MKTMIKNKEIDWLITAVPLTVIIAVAFFLLKLPDSSMRIVDSLWYVFVNKFGFFYMLLGLGLVITAIGLAFSKYGKIKLGNIEKPRYSDFEWGSMIFTSTMAADILYWSLIEWAYYFRETPFGMKNLTFAEKQDWASAYPLFHWGITPWAFYIVPAVAFGFMLHVRGRTKQKLSESCRPIFGKHIDRGLGKLIDVFSVIGLLAGTATTFSLATPLLSLAVSSLFGIPESKILTLIILLVIAAVYTAAVLLGLKGISRLAKISVISFCILLGLVFIASPKIYIIETGITGIGKVLQNFFPMSTWMDPLRISGSEGSGFPQNWTVFYWAYWIAWFVATPFFIGTISEGRTIKNTVIGGLLCGIAGTYCSFIILGNYGLHLQVQGILDSAAALNNVEPSKVILQILQTLPYSKLVLTVLVVTMIAFYSSTFDAITLVIASYSQTNLEKNTEPKKGLRAFWSIVFVLLPAALILTGTSLNQLQSLSIIAAFPLGIIIILITISLFKELKSTEKI
ncbi:BCCT family transporter [Treponema pedis]|uniref:Choline/carnitine/betaine transporter n=1 Tax=Treponema pedis str. T A4 TaxID=1291379 RepID=S5ZX58_9SPIR|nr:BCCT family transporter [Treponema pedis]AGT42563.1 choline/carnitine/betaine transporter [Treponema pedis str. T A4]